MIVSVSPIFHNGDVRNIVKHIYIYNTHAHTLSIEYLIIYYYIVVAVVVVVVGYGPAEINRVIPTPDRHTEMFFYLQYRVIYI